jgi:signal transduction histidine kinase/uncharacterized protein YdeI (BOF family)
MQNVPYQSLKLGWLVIGQVALLLALPLRAEQAPLTLASQVQALSPAEAAQGRPVKIRSTVTFYNRDWNGLFIQDATGAIYVNCRGLQDGAVTNLQPGQIIEVTGKTEPGPVHCDVAAGALRVVGTNAVPAPLDLSVTNRLSVENERLRVKATGQVFGVDAIGARPALQLLTTEGLSLKVVVQSGSLAEVENLRGNSIEFEGILGLELTRERHHTGRYIVLVTGMDAILTIKTVPIVPIAKLAADGQQARIRGSVVNQQSNSLLVRDASGVVEVECGDKVDLRVGSTVDVFGYPERRSDGIVMTRAQASVSMIEDPTLPVITRISEIRDLSVAQAARSFPIHVRGVVTVSDDDQGLYFVQDGTAGIYVDITTRRFDVFPHAGARIELWGATGPGDFAPVIKAEEVHELGPGRYPNATHAPFQLLMTGAEDSQWIEFNGVVRSASVNSNHTLAALSTGDTVIQMVVLDGVHAAPTNFVGASIEARGVCRTLFDDHRHFKGFGFCVPSWDQVEIKEAEVADPFQLALCPVSGLFEFHAGGYGLNRSHIRGQVILRQRDGQFFVQDDSGGILVQGGGAIPGADWVEVVGFPAFKDQLPMLQDALVHTALRTAQRAMPAVRLTPETALDESLNATLVSLDGRVLAQSSGTGEEIVTLQFAQRLTDAIMEKTEGNPLPRFQPGSTVRFTGVYVARLDNSRQIQSFQILLRSPADAVVVSVPPWWTARRVLWLFGGFAVVLLLSLAWVAALRQQVFRRTAQLQSEIEERKRMEVQVEKAHRELMDISRQAGMAEVATSVLHNVGNVLNSVVVSASVAAEKVKNSKSSNVARLADMLRAHASDLDGFLTTDSKGSRLPAYCAALAEHLATERNETLEELNLLRGNVEHITEIVAMQQNYAKVSGLRESLSVVDLVEDALRLGSESLGRHGIRIEREYETLPPVEVEKHKLLQILVNLIQNAKNALIDSEAPEKRLTLRVGWADEGLVRISIIDNGVGIAPENLTRIFAHGFTTRKDGHGFGLHSGALAVREMGGCLSADSAGLGKGATFTIEFPAAAVTRLQPAA